MNRIRQLRLECQFFSVDARLARINGSWIASVDTPEGPTLAVGVTAVDALAGALEPFDGLIEELLESVPRHVLAEA
jgi:hypothetical protein